MTHTIEKLINAPQALFVVSHSGGKDSQAMLETVVKLVPRDRILVVHASLGRFEWAGALEIAQEHAAKYNLPFRVAHARWKDGSEKTFGNMVESRFEKRPDAPSFPSKNLRFCTSDLKRGPIRRVINEYLEETSIEPGVRTYTIVVDCEGLRADESADRAKKEVFKQDKSQSNSKKTTYHWLPIHDWTTAQVWVAIRGAKLNYHPAYDQGNERLSCLFCIYGSVNDLRNGAKHAPHIAREIDALEQKTGSVLHMSRKPLRDLIGDAIDW